MSDDLRAQAYRNFSQQETEALLAIWRDNDRYEWSDITFDVIREILRERYVELPPQDEPSYQRRRLTPIVAGESWQDRNLDLSRQSEASDGTCESMPDTEGASEQPLRTGRSVGVRGTLGSRHQEDAETAAPISEQKNLEGLGGWLILVGLGVILSPLAMIMQFLQVYPSIFTNETWEVLTTPGAAAYHPLWGPILITEIVVNVGMVLARLFLVSLFFSKKRAFPKWFIGITVFNLAFIFVDALAIQAVLPDIRYLEEALGQLANPVLSALIWVPYMMVSKRVKVTFVR